MIFDYAIFGAGVIGSAIASKLTRLGKSVVLIEKNTDVAMGASKANSGLIHAGFDAKEGTLKARLNVQGNKMFDKLAKELSISFKRTGALVVGNDLEKLKQLKTRGENNGVQGLEIIKKDKLYGLVPNLKKDIKYALYAKTAGIISPYMLTVALAEEAVINGAKVVFRFDTKKIKQNETGFEISDGKNVVVAKEIINAAANGFNEISKLLKTEMYSAEFRRGEYFVLDKGTGFVELTVFPLPTADSKGILVTPTASGNVLLGPTSDVCDYNTKTTTEGLQKIRDNVSNLFDNIPWNKVIREYSGVRVVCGDDFIVQRSNKNSKVVNVFGICSPGLSAAPAIAEYVARDILQIKGKENFVLRKPYTKMSNLSLAKKNEIISKNKAYGKIVCRCEVISEGEILEAINSPLKPTTVDAVKRRVRAGMGRCQGGFCSLKVAELISSQTGIPFDKIEKDDVGSFLMIDDIKSRRVL